MNDMIAGYRCLTPMQTAGSGSAQWCIASRGLERYFLKEFLSPVYPVNPATPLGQKQLQRCEQFERRKQMLYEAVSCIIGDMVVPVVDFFRFDGHYYAVSEAAPDGHMTAEASACLNPEDKKRLLYELALCLQRMHTQGVVHADLKPEHVILLRQPEGWKARLIDLDSGFLADDPPQHARDIEGDPAYLAPETFLRMMGEDVPLGPELDTFAFGAMIHRIWTGKLPEFERHKYHYLYEAALDGAEIELDLPEEYRHTVRSMLHADPRMRPSDAKVAALLMPEKGMQQYPSVNNGLNLLMKR